MTSAKRPTLLADAMRTASKHIEAAMQRAIREAGEAVYIEATTGETMKIHALREILDQYTSSELLTTQTAWKLMHVCKALGLAYSEALAVFVLCGYCEPRTFATLAHNVEPIWQFPRNYE